MALTLVTFYIVLYKCQQGVLHIKTDIRGPVRDFYKGSNFVIREVCAENFLKREGYKLKENYRKNLQKKQMYLANTYSFDVLLIKNIYKINEIILSHAGKEKSDIYNDLNKGINFKKAM
jgi:hypothetical protein